MKFSKRSQYGDVKSSSSLVSYGGSASVETDTMVAGRARLRMVMARSRQVVPYTSAGDGYSLSFTNGESGDTKYELRAFNSGSTSLYYTNFRNQIVDLGQHGILFDDGIWVSRVPLRVCFDYVTIFYS